MLPDSERARIIEEFVPQYENHKASHITNAIDEKVLPQDAFIVIVGRVYMGGVEALVVTVDGSSTRPDGGTYHITLSLADGRESKESNDILKQHGWLKVRPMPINTRAFLTRGESYITTPLTSNSDLIID